LLLLPDVEKHEPQKVQLMLDMPLAELHVTLPAPLKLKR
jgi:hypothetical protein